MTQGEWKCAFIGMHFSHFALILASGVEPVFYMFLRASRFALILDLLASGVESVSASS